MNTNECAAADRSVPKRVVQKTESCEKHRPKNRITPTEAKNQTNLEGLTPGIRLDVRINLAK